MKNRSKLILKVVPKEIPGIPVRGGSTYRISTTKAKGIVFFDKDFNEIGWTPLSNSFKVPIGCAIVKFPPPT